MSTNRIYCVGDGYAHGHIWPEWPQLMQCLFPESDVICITGIGAGNEFLISELLAHDIKNSKVIFQWAQANRFDKLLEDHSWDDAISQDKDYSKNIVNGWWLSSASNNADVQRYHQYYIQPKQAAQRQHIQQTLLESYLEANGCEFVFTSTSEQENYSQQEIFRSVRQNQIQPSPVVHLYFLKDIVLPQLKISPDEKIYKYVSTKLKSTHWTPYHPDRELILNTMISHCKNINTTKEQSHAKKDS